MKPNTGNECKGTAVRHELMWRSGDATHRDIRVSRHLEGFQTSGVRSYAPGQLVPPLDERLLLEVDARRFMRRASPRLRVEPRLGRFYPPNLIEDLPGILSRLPHAPLMWDQDQSPSGLDAPVRGERAGPGPFRVVGWEKDRLCLDFNHPLAGYVLEVSMQPLGMPLSESASERGQSNAQGLITSDGPGMQARWQGRPTDFWSDDPFSREDAGPDAQFYARPRLVDHLDRTAIAELSAIYASLIPAGGRVLDLMASWHSHLDRALPLDEVVGLGMNASELDANPRLTEAVVHDLNLDPLLPFEDQRFDAVVCTVSVEYLIRPFEVFREIARVLRPGGRCIMSFSNRWFPPKVIRIWSHLHAFERLALVLDYLRDACCFEGLQTWTLSGLPRPEDDKYASRLSTSDPLYVVWGERCGSDAAQDAQ